MYQISNKNIVARKKKIMIMGRCNYYESPNLHTFGWFGATALNLDSMTYWEGWNHWYPQKYVEFVFWSISRDFGQSNLLAWAVLLQCIVIETSLSNTFNGNFMFSKVFYPRYSGQGWAFKKEICRTKRILFWLECEIQFQTLVAPLGCSTLTLHIW